MHAWPGQINGLLGTGTKNTGRAFVSKGASPAVAAVLSQTVIQLYVKRPLP